MAHVQFIAWIIILLVTLIYLGLLYYRQQYRHRYAFFRLIVLFSLLLLLRPLPEVFSKKPFQSLFVIVDTSKSMKQYFNDSSKISDLKELLPRNALDALESRYPNHEKYYYDLYRPSDFSQRAGKDFSPEWGLQSPILTHLFQFVETVAPPETSELLLISDGHDTEFSEIPEALQEKLHQKAFALNALVIPAPSSEQDLDIVQVNNPRVVFNKTPVFLDVKIRSQSKIAQTAHLILTDGQAILDKQRLDILQGTHTFESQLKWIPENAGHALLFLRLTPLEGEKNLYNNVAYIPITVRNHRHRVLHIAGRPSWDVMHLRSLLKSIPALDLISFYILRDPYRDSQTVPENELALIHFPVKELFQVELFKFDTVIFHNFAIQSYLHNPAYQKSFQKYLSDGNKIIVVGGEQAIGQQKYQQLFLKQGEAPFAFELQNALPASLLESQQLSSAYLRQQPSFASVAHSQSPQLELVQRTYFDLGQVDWVANSMLWAKQHALEPDLLGQSGDFAAFWNTLLYQPEYEKENVFQEFQQGLPYPTTQPIKGHLSLPSQSTKALKTLHLQVRDQLLNQVVWDAPVSIDKQAMIQLPALAPSMYELRLSCGCAEMSDIFQKFTVVDQWLEQRTVFPQINWLKQLVKSTGGELIEVQH